MRTLQFSSPYKVHGTTLSDLRTNQPGQLYYCRTVCVKTKFGLVEVCDMNWDDNHGGTEFTVFSTVLKGYEHSAFHPMGRLSDRCIKWLATNFIKKVYGK